MLQKKGGVLAMLALVAALVAAPGLALATGPTFALPTAEIEGHIAIALAFIVAIGGGVLDLVYMARAFGWAKLAR